MLDIGSNDATLLQVLFAPGLKRIGIDPTGTKFRKYYPDDIALVPSSFPRRRIVRSRAQRRKIVTSIAMFYDSKTRCNFA